MTDLHVLVHVVVQHGLDFHMLISGCGARQTKVDKETLPGSDAERLGYTETCSSTKSDFKMEGMRIHLLATSS